jgi:hypothetical protein
MNLLVFLLPVALVVGQYIAAPSTTDRCDGCEA